MVCIRKALCKRLQTQTKEGQQLESENKQR